MGLVFLSSSNSSNFVLLTAGLGAGVVAAALAAAIGHFNAPVSVETLVDSPLFAGRHVKQVPLDPPGAAKPVSLDELHQSCVRAVRADYCGNGVSHTRNGTPIDVYDVLGIQNPDNIGGNTVEADWRSDGAYCIKHTRWGTADSTLTPGETDLQYVQRVCPSRLAQNDASCSNDANSTFFQANGFGLNPQSSRKVLRNQSYLH